MAIAFDAQSVSAYAPNTSVTWSHTCTGTDRILIVGVYCGTANTTTVTYNGVSMTAINSLAMSGAASGQFIKLFYLVNPASGANNVVVSCSAGDMYGLATSYTGAKQSAQPDSNNTGGNATATSLTVSTTTVADNCWLVGFVYCGLTPTAGANTILRNGIASVEYMIDSNSAQTPAGSKSMNVTHGSTFNGMVMASISPVASAFIPSNNKNLNGAVRRASFY